MQTAHDIAPCLTYSEAEAFAIMLRALGSPESAERWLDKRAMGDEEDEMHYERSEHLAARL
ncbi:hypothetical protein [Gryllotalpicola protaetiae]|uniref:Uncharacterized protein n=1 Tax=Gryllotalpicola protaetiae TaxID=2419771 RepID=A0A387BHP8_9MICO|nr:hypothetical protein [Gryllotalpicola protaetiae]AYG03555.1 hypothetical protein D7I44_08425 [Gryllotalpicola protaetiae]